MPPLEPGRKETDAMSQFVQINPTTTGRKYWRSLDQLSGSPEFKQWVEQEFPENATDAVSAGSRRNLLKLMAASFGLAGLAACRRPVEHILPFSKGVEGLIPGKPLHYATVATVGGAATGLMVETHEGRPTKVEGNEKHPASLGATSAHMQALVLSLYDPDRSKGVKRDGQRSSWDEFTAWAKDEFSAEKQGGGSGLRVLAEHSSSPSLQSLRGELSRKFPKSQWVEFDSVNFDNPRLGAALAFGQPLEAHYEYDKADVVLALDADFLGLDSQTVLPIKKFSAKRRVSDPKSAINRLYAAESNYTLTGAMADHRLRLRASDVGALALALARELNVSGGELKALSNATDASARFIASVAKDLAAHKGRSIVVAGPRQPKEVHALAALINQALGNTGETVLYTAPIVTAADSVAAVKQLTSDLNSGQVKTLVVLGGNPVYTLPADLNFAQAIKKAASTIVLTAEENETWAAAQWQLPEAHVFESWGDARALDGTVSIQQPMVAPLYYGKPALEVAAMVAGLENTKAHDIVKSYWSAQWGAAADKTWKQSLYNGLIDGGKLEPVKPVADAAKLLASISASLKPAPVGLEVVFFPGHSTWDGRFANNAWMQEAPDPMTKVVWDNAALLSQATADKLGVKNGSVVNVSSGGYGSDVAVMVMPGHADDSISLTLGYGRSACGRVGRGVGHRVEGIRTTAGFHFAQASVTPNGATYQLVTTQEHHTLEEPITGKLRPIVLEATMEEYTRHPDHFEHAVHVPEVVNMFEQFDWSKGQQWGMTIDLNACIGCNACLVACQAENNIPVVGKDQVRRGREMHWIRLDRYFTGKMDDPQVVNQPMACVQCENAPCESVCPVAATTHSPEGLNDMAYNRCVGTRYCANNCPYKVRRFNFFNWNKNLAESQKMAFNPDVTVRMRGVMEKCNYCVQRIQEKKIEAKANNRAELKDGDVKSACQQVCPADAIVFGNINDPQSRVAQMKKQQRDYILLEELNVKPRTSYLGKLRNPNPELIHG